VRPTGPFELVKSRAWATVYRVPIDGGQAYFKACAPVQAFEPRLTGALAARWPDRLPEVLAFDEDRAWLLTVDAGRPIGELGNDPALWLRVLPRYAELQRGEAAVAVDHLAHGVPDLRTTELPARFRDLGRRELPIGATESAALRRLAARFEALCGELAAGPVADSVQHDDLHVNAVFVRDDALRVLDWGDASIGHPLFSLVVTFRFLREENGLDPADPWFPRLRDAYLEPWGRDLVPLFELAQRVGTVAHAFTWLRHRDVMDAAARREFDELFPGVLRSAIAALRRD
jgi:hypothetical protein